MCDPSPNGTVCLVAEYPCGNDLRLFLQRWTLKLKGELADDGSGCRTPNCQANGRDGQPGEAVGKRRRSWERHASVVEVVWVNGSNRW